MCYKIYEGSEVFKVGYLILGVLSNQFKLPIKGCWRLMGNLSVIYRFNNIQVAGKEHL